MSGKVESIGDTYTPGEIVNNIPWDKVTQCIVIYEVEGESGTFLQVSEMTWKDRVWLTQSLVDYNTISQIVVNTSE